MGTLRRHDFRVLSELLSVDPGGRFRFRGAGGDFQPRACGFVSAGRRFLNDGWTAKRNGVDGRGRAQWERLFIVGLRLCSGAGLRRDCSSRRSAACNLNMATVDIRLRPRSGAAQWRASLSTEKILTSSAESLGVQALSRRLFLAITCKHDVSRKTGST